jgi:hypothetical protein
MKFRKTAFLLISLLISLPLFGEEEQAQPTEQGIPVQEAAPNAESTAQGRSPNAPSPDEAILQGDEVLNLDFENPDVYIDTSEAIRSKQYVRRAILSSVIDATSKFSFSRVYLNHLLGFNAVYQLTRFAKYTSGMQGLSLGYVSEGGHGWEAGMEISTVSNIFAGYRHFFRLESFSLWPFAGLGAGHEVPLMAFADVPTEARDYAGKKSFGFVGLGVLIPLVDVGLKAEIRGNFYGFDRLVLTQGIGAILFF